MGRLFWKFFLILWLIQLLGALATGAFIWLEHQRRDSPPPHHTHQMAEPPHGPPPHENAPPPPRDGFPRPPLAHIATGLLLSLLAAAGLAAYVSRPVRRLEKAFQAISDGDLAQRIGDGMGKRNDELNDLGKGFDRMADKLQSQIEAQQRLLHDVSHELRSPLARLQAAIGLARQQPGRLEETMTRIERESERMDRLVGELLTLARLSAGETGEQESFLLDELLDSLIEDARFEARARNIQISVRQASPVLVSANPALLHRALENVLRNALRHSPDSGLIRIELVPRSATQTCITIADQGAGVAVEELPHIFTPFHRGNNGSNGYGLGLAIARRVITGIGGRIFANNLDEGGFQVSVELPAQLP